MSSRKSRTTGAKFKVTQSINHPDGSTDKKERIFDSLKDFKRSMTIMGFPVHITYDLQKHGNAHFDYEEFSISMTLEVF